MASTSHFRFPSMYNTVPSTFRPSYSSSLANALKEVPQQSAQTAPASTADTIATTSSQQLYLEVPSPASTSFTTGPPAIAWSQTSSNAHPWLVSPQPRRSDLGHELLGTLSPAPPSPSASLIPFTMHRTSGFDYQRIQNGNAYATAQTFTPDYHLLALQHSISLTGRSTPNFRDAEMDSGSSTASRGVSSPSSIFEHEATPPVHYVPANWASTTISTPHVTLPPAATPLEVTRHDGSSGTDHASFSPPTRPYDNLSQTYMPPQTTPVTTYTTLPTNDLSPHEFVLAPIGPVRTARKRRVSPKPYKMDRDKYSDASSVGPSSPRPAKRNKRDEDEHHHVHIANITCSHPDCTAPRDIDEPGVGPVEMFGCPYIDPQSGSRCESDFRRRGCRDRHNASHSGREAQDVSARRLALGSARRILWETIRVVDQSDWTRVYPMEGENADWTSHFEIATNKVYDEFNVDVLRQQANHVRDTLFAMGQEEVRTGTYKIAPIDLSRLQEFSRLAYKRALSYERFYCRHPRCESDFTRADALMRHQRTCHEPKGRKAKRSSSTDI